jgi:hypothetical protein
MDIAKRKHRLGENLCAFLGNPEFMSDLLGMTLPRPKV